MIDTYSYFNGISAAIYFLACLLCGLQLILDLPFQRNSGNLFLSRLVGTILLGLSCTAICYILSAAFPPLVLLYQIGSTVDLVLFIGVGCVGYVVYTNNQPSVKTLLALALPFVAIALAFVLVPSLRKHLIDYAMIVLILYYTYYGVLLHRSEKLLADIYSDSHAHSIKWINGIVTLLVGWWVLRFALLKFSLHKWYDPAIYVYMSGFVMFVFYKISSYGKTVSIETQKDNEQGVNGNVSMTADMSNQLQRALIGLLEDQKIYLDPDLKVDDVSRKLGTNAKYFSALLRNDMNTTFCELINTYRVEESKKLLKNTDYKIVKVALLCGYHSADTFSRNFAKITGIKPTDWRVSCRVD